MSGLLTALLLFAGSAFASGRCQDTAEGANFPTAHGSGDCAFWDLYKPFCSESPDFYDDTDFTAAAMCCACGGGAQTEVEVKNCTNNNGKDHYDTRLQQCEAWEGQEHLCSSAYDDKDFSALVHCCACGGGVDTQGCTSNYDTSLPSVPWLDCAGLEEAPWWCPTRAYDDSDWTQTIMCCICNQACDATDGSTWPGVYPCKCGSTYCLDGQVCLSGECQLPPAIHVEWPCQVWDSMNFSVSGTTLGGSPFYESADGKYIYYDPDCSSNGELGRWVLDDQKPSLTASVDLDDDGACAYLARTSLNRDHRTFRTGLSGDTRWRMHCNGMWAYGMVAINPLSQVLTYFETPKETNAMVQAADCENANNFAVSAKGVGCHYATRWISEERCGKPDDEASDDSDFTLWDMCCCAEGQEPPVPSVWTMGSRGGSCDAACWSDFGTLCQEHGWWPTSLYQLPSIMTQHCDVTGGDYVWRGNPAMMDNGGCEYDGNLPNAGLNRCMQQNPILTRFCPCQKPDLPIWVASQPGHSCSTACAAAPGTVCMERAPWPTTPEEFEAARAEANFSCSSLAEGTWPGNPAAVDGVCSWSGVGSGRCALDYPNTVRLCPCSRPLCEDSTAAAGIDGQTCEDLAVSQSPCSDANDDEDFSALASCCACGGGQVLQMATPAPTADGVEYALGEENSTCTPGLELHTLSECLAANAFLGFGPYHFAAYDAALPPGCMRRPGMSEFVWNNHTDGPKTALEFMPVCYVSAAKMKTSVAAAIAEGRGEECSDSVPDGATDNVGDVCEDWVGIEDDCADFAAAYDDSDFSALDGCCACGGGIMAGEAPPSPVPTPALDAEAAPTDSPTPAPASATAVSEASPVPTPAPDAEAAPTDSPTPAPTPGLPALTVQGTMTLEVANAAAFVQDPAAEEAVASAMADAAGVAHGSVPTTTTAFAPAGALEASSDEEADTSGAEKTTTIPAMGHLVTIVMAMLALGGRDDICGIASAE